MIDRFEKFIYVISDIDRCWHKIAAEVMEGYGLKGPYAVYFTTMYRHGEGITAAQLGELCGRDKADVSRAISTLERKGLVQKVGGSQNLYRAPILLTDTGKEMAEQINAKARAAVELGGKGLSEEHRATFYQALDLIASNLRNLSKEGLPVYESDQ